MTNKDGCIAVLDTNILYPVVTRDLLFWFAYYDLFKPKWSKQIFNEWKNIMERKGVSFENSNKRIHYANLAFPDALIRNYESLIGNLKLPDLNDNHVLAAAIKAKANIIVTNNLKDFPKDYLSNFGLKIKSADDFLYDLIILYPTDAILAFNEMVLNKIKPDLTKKEVIAIIHNTGLKNTANKLEALI